MQTTATFVLLTASLTLSACFIEGGDADHGVEPAPSGLEESPAAVPPGCRLAVSSSGAVDGELSADHELLLEGACTIPDGASAPADLTLWVESTWRDDDGQTHSERFEAGGDTGDTGALGLVFEADGDEARLFGFVSLPAGSHQLCLYAQDQAGNRNGDDACADLRVLPANTPPRCEIVLPLSGTTGVLGEPLRLEALVDDVDQGPAGLRVEWRSDRADQPLASVSADPDGRVRTELVLAEAVPTRQLLTLVVEDAQGERCTDVVEHSLGYAPSLWIDSPASGERLDRHDPVTLVGGFEDAESACEDLEVEWLLVDARGERSVGDGPWLAEGCRDSTLLDPALDGSLEVGDARLYLLVTDEDGATNTTMTWLSIGDCGQDWYPDLDGDGYGDASAAPRSSCSQPSGYSSIAGDCDDGDAAINPAASEACNGLDDDCDGVVDGGFEVAWFYADRDGDGYGDEVSPYDVDGDGAGDAVCAQASLPGWTTVAGDCDDGAASVHPGATERCDAYDLDEDCDGLADDADGSATGQASWFWDDDGDGYGSSASVAACDQPYGAVANSDDCDDGAASVHPGATERCDAYDVDEDCDGLADDADSSASGKSTWHRDADGDGYGSATTTSACDQPTGWVSNSSDCDDGCASCHPGASELRSDGGDNDCDGVVDECGHSLSSCTANSADEVACCIEALGSAGGTVSMSWSGESTFDQTIELVSNLTLEGRGKTDTILRFAGDDQDDLLQGYDSSDVTLRGFTLYGTRSTADCTCNSSGDSCEPGSGRSGDSCGDETQAGIIFKKDSGSGISDIVVEDVSVKYARQYGLHVKYATNVKIDNVTAGYNGTYRAEDHNIYVYRSDNVLITDSGSRYSAGHGINIRGCNDVVVHDTVVGYNHHAGIRASGAAIQQSDGSYTGEDSADILFDNVDSLDNNNEGVQLAIESSYNVHRACVKNSYIQGNAIGVEFNYTNKYQRSSNSYSGNGTKESISSSSQDSSVCGGLPTGDFTWGY